MATSSGIDLLERRFEQLQQEHEAIRAWVSLAGSVAHALVGVQATIIERQREAIRTLSPRSAHEALADIVEHRRSIERLRRLHHALHQRIQHDLMR